MIYILLFLRSKSIFHTISDELEDKTPFFKWLDNQKAPSKRVDFGPFHGQKWWSADIICYSLRSTTYLTTVPLLAPNPDIQHRKCMLNRFLEKFWLRHFFWMVKLKIGAKMLFIFLPFSSKFLMFFF